MQALQFLMGHKVPLTQTGKTAVVTVIGVQVVATTFNGTVATSCRPLLLAGRTHLSRWILQKNKKLGVWNQCEGKWVDLTYLSGKHHSPITGNTISLLGKLLYMKDPN